MSKNDITLKFKTPNGFDFSDSFSPAPNGRKTSYKIKRSDDSDDCTFASIIVETASPDQRTLSRSFQQGTNEASVPTENGVTVTGISVNPSNLHFEIDNQTKSPSDLTVSLRLTVNDGTTGKTSESPDPQITIEAGAGPGG